MSLYKSLMKSLNQAIAYEKGDKTMGEAEKVAIVDAVEVVRCGECIRAVNEWISASAPPKDHKEYIVMIKGATCPTTLWYRPNQKTWNVASDDKNYIVTHWMPMPEPPKGE